MRLISMCLNYFVYFNYNWFTRYVMLLCYYVQIFLINNTFNDKCFEQSATVLAIKTNTNNAVLKFKIYHNDAILPNLICEHELHNSCDT